MKNIREKIKVKGLKRDNSFAENIDNAIENKELRLFNATIILRLLDYMDEYDLTQKDIATIVGVSAQQVNKLLRGSDQNFKVETILKLEKALGIKLIMAVDNDTAQEKNNIYSSCLTIPLLSTTYSNNDSANSYRELA